MNWIVRNSKKAITYWAFNEGAFAGTYVAPVAIQGRWEEKQELFIGEDGESLLSKSVAYLNADVDPGGYLFEGTSSATDPTTVDGAQRIAKFEKTPDLRNIDSLRKVYLL